MKRSEDFRNLAVVFLRSRFVDSQNDTAAEIQCPGKFLLPGVPSVKLTLGPGAIEWPDLPDWIPDSLCPGANKSDCGLFDMLGEFNWFELPVIDVPIAGTPPSAGTWGRIRRRRRGAWSSIQTFRNGAGLTTSTATSRSRNRTYRASICYLLAFFGGRGGDLAYGIFTPSRGKSLYGQFPTKMQK
jgi:hypothetical protein